MTKPRPAKKLILQRTVAHYRVPLFEKLHTQGWQVVSAGNFPTKVSALQTSDKKQPFQIFENFIFPKKSNPYLCHVPLLKILKTHKPEILLMEAGSTMSSTWLAALWCRLKRNRTTKIVFWGHGALVANKTGLKGKLASSLKTWLINSVDAYLCYTEADKAFLGNLNLKTPIFAAGNTIDISQQQSLRQAPEAPSKNLLFVGRLTEDKKVPELINLFKSLNMENAKLTIIGDGPEMPAVKKAANSAENIKVTGAIYDTEKLAKHYNASDLFITLGAVGLGVNESLAFGLPVLCYKDSDTGPHHHPEITYVKDGITGWQISPHTHEAMQAKLEELLNAPAKADMYQSVIDYADANLTIESMAQNILNMEAEL